jgi:UDP-N-acetylglucosamine--dolichyl-phosphate N-acetylglucosaminephosphotransferase
MDPLLLIPLLASFFITLFVLPKWIGRARRIGLVGKDMNKYRDEQVAESGGLIVILSFLFSVLIYISLRVFYFSSEVHLIEIFSLTTSVLILAFIGVMDDFLGWKIGLSKKVRLILVLFASIPLIAINAGSSHVNLPFLNGVDIGLFYPLLIIPLGIVGATTTFNFLAGYNGLEAGQGIILLSSLSLVSYLTGSPWLSFIGALMVFSLLGFLIFNKFPSKVFPGDVLTYSVGGLIAIMAILGDFERVALFFFIPYLLETILKLRGKLKPQSFAEPREDGGLDLRYNKIYGLEHLSIKILKKIKGEAREKDVVFLLHSFQIVIILLGLLIFNII